MSVLDQQSKLNASAALYAPASGGGGGAVGPNPSFSTIILNGTSGVGIPNLNFPGNNAVIASLNSVQFTDSPFTNSQIVLSPQNPPAIELNNDANQYGIQIGITTDGYGYIQSGTGGVGIALSNISSINGAAPGGGGSGPNLTVSTVTGQNGDVGTDTAFILRQASDGSGRTQLAYNTTDMKGFGTYPFLTTSAPAGVDMGNICCALNSNAEPASFGIGGGTTAQGALVFNDPAGANDNWIIGGGGGMTIYAPDSINFSTLALQQNGVPIGGSVPGNLTVSSLTLAGTGSAGGATLGLAASDTDLYQISVLDNTSSFVAGMSIGLVGGRNQVYIDSNAQIGNQLWVSSIQNCKEAFVSSFNVSSINGLAAGGSSLTNNTYPFTTGSDNTGVWQLTVASNTSGSPQYLTNSVTTNSSNSYLVTVNLNSGSNSDTATTSITKLALQLSGGNDVTLGSFPGFNNFWIYNGTVGSKTAIVRGASAIRLYAWATSPTNSTDLYFDTATGMSITNLGPSS